MKKIFMIAVVACAALMVACGGEKKETVESKAEQLALQLYDAVVSEDGAKVEAAVKALHDYGQNLSVADQDKLVNAHMDALAKKIADVRANGGDKYLSDVKLPQLTNEIAVNLYGEIDETLPQKFRDVAQKHYYKATGLDKK